MMTSAAVRGDVPRYFGTGGRVRAARLFPLPASYTPGLKVLPGGVQESDALYDQLAELLARPDALDPQSETGKRIAEVESKLAKLEQAEADELQAAFEATLLLPPDAGAAFDKKLADVLSAIRDRTSDDPAAGQS